MNDSSETTQVPKTWKTKSESSFSALKWNMGKNDRTKLPFSKMKLDDTSKTIEVKGSPVSTPSSDSGFTSSSEFNSYIVPKILVTNYDDELELNIDEDDNGSTLTSESTIFNNPLPTPPRRLPDNDILPKKKHVYFADEASVVSTPSEEEFFILKSPNPDGKFSRHVWKPTTLKQHLIEEKSKNGREYAISDPQGDDLYSPLPKPTTLPPLQQVPTEGTLKKRRVRKGKPRAHSVVSKYIHGGSPMHARNNSLLSAKSRINSASSVLSKDDSRIQYETVNEELPLSGRMSHQSTNSTKGTTIRVFKNGDVTFPGIQYRYKAGKDVPNMEGLLDKLSDRISLPRGVRFLFDLHGTRKFVLEELEDGKSYVGSSDKKFQNLAYGKRKSWRERKNGRVGSPVVRLLGRVPSTSSGSSTSSKPSSREGRRIKIVNTLDKQKQDVSVLVNVKTAQSWEDVVGDLGQVLKMKGDIELFTPEGNEVKSFSQFNNEYATLETFHLRLSEQRNKTPTIEANGSVVSKNTRIPTSRSQMTSGHPMQRSSSEPALRGLSESGREYVTGKTVNVVIRGQKRILYAPSNPVGYNSNIPSHTLSLDWVYGYRGADNRKNLVVLPSGELVYYVAAVAVLYDRRRDIQRHYTQHTEDIQCLAVHPTKSLIATGQRASRHDKMTAHVRVWSAKTLSTLQVLGRRELGIGVISVAFSPKNNGQYLLAVDADHEHLLSVWLWDTQKIFGKVATQHDHVLGSMFHPRDSNLIITYGRSLLTLWTRRKDGIFQRCDLIKEKSGKTITSLDFTSNGDIITGDSDGKINVWSVDIEGRYFIKKEFQAHDGPISTLQQLSEGTILSGGEKDRKIIAWDSMEDFEKVAETKLPDSAGSVRTVYPQSPGENDGNIYVGTTRNMILEGSLQRRFNQVVFGHSKQLWGLSVNQRDGTFVTGGYDKQIVKWAYTKPAWRIQAQSECVSTAIHPKGTVIVAGTIDGHMIFLNSLTGVHVTLMRVCGSPISCLAYNSVGDMLAAGSQNGSIYIFKSSKEGFVYTRLKRMSGYQAISAIDWSRSEKYLQTVTSDYDVIFWNYKEASQVKDISEVRNEEWQTQTCSLSYMVHGIWAGNKMVSSQISVDRDNDRQLLAAGDADGHLRLYRYPVLNMNASYHQYKMCTSYISGVRFSSNFDYLYTIGGTDAALMRWRIEQ